MKLRSSMRVFLLAAFLSLLSLLWLSGSPHAIAEDFDPALLEQKLRTYDPALVEAARANLSTFDTAKLVSAALPHLGSSIEKEVKEKNPALSEAQVKEYMDAFGGFLLVKLQQAQLLTALDLFTREELLAAHEFNSSPVGRSIADTTPRLMSKLPQAIVSAMQDGAPEAVRAAQEKMRKSGVDVKLWETFPSPAEDLNAKPFEERLKAYKAESVELARAYFSAFDFKKQVAGSIPLLSRDIALMVKAENPALNDAEIKEFSDTFGGFFLEKLEQAELLVVLDVFTKDELLAMNGFYSSSAGRSMIGKMPIMMGRLPETMMVLEKKMVPEAARAAQEKMRKSGVDVKL